ncbi:ion transporter [Actinoplanes sp. TRM 88003]|uniref:Ion transporter n=1 Tax=Paractinoplanes aksuensis TaxID=2939490 RepID=A0ABT1E1I2_9ACTN|nr:ion transporter [Actinoplanes aksuensis]MCO8276972.1 ion transporter [Actinoplanes aksuensis]
MARTTHRLSFLCGRLVEGSWFHLAGFAVIVVNAVALGLETYDPVVVAAGGWLRAVEHACVAAFAVELLIRFGASPRGFLRDGWNVFDLANLLVGLVLTALQEAHEDERAAVKRPARPGEPSVHEQLAALRTIIGDLERRLPVVPAQPLIRGGGGEGDRDQGRSADDRSAGRGQLADRDGAGVVP